MLATRRKWRPECFGPCCVGAAFPPTFRVEGSKTTVERENGHLFMAVGPEKPPALLLDPKPSFLLNKYIQFQPNHVKKMAPLCCSPKRGALLTVTVIPSCLVLLGWTGSLAGGGQGTIWDGPHGHHPHSPRPGPQDLSQITEPRVGKMKMCLS